MAADGAVDLNPVMAWSYALMLEDLRIAISAPCEAAAPHNPQVSAQTAATNSVPAARPAPRTRHAVSLRTFIGGRWPRCLPSLVTQLLLAPALRPARNRAD